MLYANFLIPIASPNVTLIAHAGVVSTRHMLCAIKSSSCCNFFLHTPGLPHQNFTYQKRAFNPLCGPFEKSKMNLKIYLSHTHERTSTILLLSVERANFNGRNIWSTRKIDMWWSGLYFITDITALCTLTNIN